MIFPFFHIHVCTSEIDLEHFSNVMKTNREIDSE